MQQEWGVGLIGSWNSAGWIDLPQRIGDKIARLVGAGQRELVVADSTSVNLFKVLSAALNIQRSDAPQRKRIVSERSNFPTDLYIAEALAKERGLELVLVDAPEDLPATLDERCAVLMLTHVNYSTGRLHDMEALTRCAHGAGAMALWDLAHSAGAVPVDLRGSGADFAVGCGYKYLNGGPGAPAFVWVAPKHAERFWQPLAGWMGHAAPFEFDPGYRPAPGIRRYLCGTPPLLSLAALECGVDSVLAAEPFGGMAALRTKSLALTESFGSLVEQRCAGHGLRRVSPRASNAARQPSVFCASAHGLCGDAGADRARRGRRFPRARHPALRLHAAVHALRRRVAGGGASVRCARRPGMAAATLQPARGGDVSDPSKTENIVRDEGAKLDFATDMSYGDYLHLDAVLNAQQPRSPDHNEMLFIVQHQTSELWMKLMLHELRAAIANVARDELGSAFKMLARVSRIMEQLVHAWDVLATMTPPEYSAIRPYLASSSGFQSWQYRCIEFSLGNKNAAMLKPHAHRADLLARVEAAYVAPSLYDEALRLLARRGLAVPASHVERDWTQAYAASAEVEAAWLVVYRDPRQYWELYQLGEELTDLEDAFRLWRFRHVTTVERIIGFKRGTGGTSGVGYLRKMLDVVLFPEIWALRTDL